MQLLHITLPPRLTARALRLFVLAAAMLSQAACAPATRAADSVWISSLDLSKMTQGYGSPGVDLSVEGHPLSINGQKFAHGVGTHAVSVFTIDLKHGAERFQASVGVDDEVNSDNRSSVEFQALGDGKLLWKSGVMKAGQAAAPVDVDVKGVGVLTLLVTDAGDGNSADHADWADARLLVTGAPPVALESLRSEAVILTPKPGPQPRINGPRVFGVRPGSPFLYTIPATGTRPMAFSVEGLPPGLHIDAGTGRITGVLPQKGEHVVTLRAKNALGTAQKKFRIVVGEEIALTPPMGWNSYNAWGTDVDSEKVLRSARALVKYGLDQHGWTYINMDDGWQGHRGGPLNAVQPDPQRFPDMKAMCDEIHGMGLKVGLYHTPWVTSYGGRVGGSSENAQGTWDAATMTQGPKNSKTLPFAIGQYHFAANDAKQWAAWGIDYLKYDWAPNELPETKEMYDALRANGRDVVLSLSNNTTNSLFAVIPDVSKYANCWRIGGDINDSWGSIQGHGFGNDQWAPFARPGHWNDPDMFEVGANGGGSPKHLTPDEQYTHVSQWCLLSAPLLLGCDLEHMDDFTLGLLTNDEVLDVDQDPLGKQATRVAGQGELIVYAKPMEDGSRVVGLFNTGLLEAPISVTWGELGIAGRQTVRDLWRQKALGVFVNKFAAPVAPHGVLLLRITPAHP